MMGAALRRGPLAAMTTLAVVLALALPLRGAAGDAPAVVVELFTSQGCSACPPADRMLQRLAERDDVLPLAFHVDYWDYIGWKDRFARPEHTARQKGYARAAGQRMIYTPHIVVGGQDHVAGADEMVLAEAVLAHAAQPRRVAIGLEREGDMLKLLAVAMDPDLAAGLQARLVVLLVRYTPRESVDILRGENAGHSFDYVNIVRAHEVVARWDATAPLELTLPAPGPERAAVLVQEAGHGPILGAAVLR